MASDRLRELVALGRLRYVMAEDDRRDDRDDPRDDRRAGGEVTAWVRATCAAVDGQDGLYLCAP